jgi:hypothetical protein
MINKHSEIILPTGIILGGLTLWFPNSGKKNIIINVIPIRLEQRNSARNFIKHIFQMKTYLTIYVR